MCSFVCKFNAPDWNFARECQMRERDGYREKENRKRDIRRIVGYNRQRKPFLLIQYSWSISILDTHCENFFDMKQIAFKIQVRGKKRETFRKLF